MNLFATSKTLRMALVLFVSLFFMGCDGSSNGDFVASGNGVIAGPNPVVILDAAQLNFDVNDMAPAVSPTATVSDDTGDLNGGTLTFSVTGAANDATFTIPAAPAIGVINNNGTSNVSVTLDANATLANIQTVLRAVTISGGATKGTGTVAVDLSDSDGNNAVQVTRTFEFTALRLTVGATGNHATIQAAINEVIVGPNGSGSTITVLADYVPVGEILDVTNDPGLVNLTVLGAAAGQSAGVTPDPARANKTLVVGILVDANGTTIDGFDVEGAPAGFTRIGDQSVNVTIKNCVFTGQLNGQSGFQSDGMGFRVENCRFTNWTTAMFATRQTAIGTVSGNAFVDNVTAISYINTDQPITVTGNGFSNNTTSVIVTNSGMGGSLVVSGNDIANNGGTVTTADNASGINAQSNWWGQAGGPLAGQTMVGAFSAGIDVSNPLAADPFPLFP